MGYTQDLVAHWDLSTDNPADICWRGNRYPGTGANIVGHPNGIAGGRCAEFNGDNSYVDIGDIVELNAVQKFTLAFWMNQDVLDIGDVIFYKFIDGNSNIFLWTHVSGQIQFSVSNGAAAQGGFDYSTVIDTGEWHHITAVFDGTQTGNANRMKIYVDGNPVTLGFVGSILAVSVDLTGIDATIGRNGISFDGKLDEFMIFSSALTQIQAADLHNRTRQWRF